MRKSYWKNPVEGGIKMSKEWILKAMDMAFQEGKGLWADSLIDVIKDLTDEQAKWKPEGKDIHSIWEIVNHIISGKKFILSALEGKKPTYQEEKGEGVSWEDTVKQGTELEFVIMVIAVSCVKLLSAHNSTQHTSRKHKV
jgi:hypothetical protein